MNLKEQMGDVGFNTDKILVIVDGERHKALGITRLTRILAKNGLHAYDGSHIEFYNRDELLGEYDTDGYNKPQELKKR